MDRLEIPATDGYALAAAVFAPADAARASVILPCAMGVRQSYYFPFAAWLAEQGFHVTTFDYRGVGDSAPARLAGFDATVTDWAVKDYNAVVRWAKARAPDAPLYVVGHSLGGQLPGLLPDAGLIDGIVTVACGNGYWRHNAPPTRRVVWWLWWFAVPVYTRLFGYFPGRRLRKVGDLPKAAILEWRRWCLHPDYLVGVIGESARSGFRRIVCPVLALAFTDDEMMSERGQRSLDAFYENAPVEMRVIAPHDVGAFRIGHFGFYRETSRTTLWPQVRDWLLAREVRAA